MDVALYLIPRQGFREQVSSIVDTSHFLEVQVTLGCFLLDPQTICVQMPQFAQSSSGTMARAALASPSTTPFMCVPRSLYIDTSPSVSADALTKPYNSASAELRATTACVLHHILMRWDPATVYPPVVPRRVFLQPSQSVSENVSSWHGVS